MTKSAGGGGAGGSLYPHLSGVWISPGASIDESRNTLPDNLRRMLQGHRLPIQEKGEGGGKGGEEREGGNR